MSAATKSSNNTLIVDFSSVGKNPLNPLCIDLRRYIWKSLDQALKDDSIHSVILYGGPRNFSAGADLTEFSQIEYASSSSNPISSSNNDFENNNGEPYFPLIDLVNKIENYPKPIVAAICGIALGGGLEIAVSCHYRISASSNAKFGLPEVHVGVIPGAGGTQRLPRLVGVAKALEMILSGKPIGAKIAKEYGLIDDIVINKDSSSVLEMAKKYADWAALMPLQDRRVGYKTIKETPEQLELIFQTAATKLPTKQMGGEGVHAALDAVKACTLSIQEGSAIELQQFMNVLKGEQGKARRHAFFAVRKAQKPLGTAPKNHPLLDKQSIEERTVVAVIGGGLMGSGICMVLLQAGYHKVYLFDMYKEALDKGVAFIKNTIESYATRNKITKEKATQMIQSLHPTQQMNDLNSCSLVVEAVIEDMNIKKKIFQQLDQITSPNCILLSNTSTLDIDEMASVVSLSRRTQFAGWHFFSPAHIMKLVEIVVGKATSLETICILQQLTKQINKIGVVVGNCDGFVGNRLLISYSAETTLLLEEGVATISSVDDTFLKFGIALGPFQMGDLAGLDIGYNVRKQRGWVSVDGKPAKNKPKRYPEIGDIIVSEYRRLGQKSGKGWYDYDNNIGKGRKALQSKEVNDMIRRYARKGQKPFTSTEIIERVLFPLVNEGFKCLEEGIAKQPSDIDVIYLYGYGWHIYKGGPMWWADNQVGLKYLLKRLEYFSSLFPDTNYYVPSELLKKCVMMDLKVEEYYNLGLCNVDKGVRSKL